MNGANGIWASVCLEGAVMGNAASCVTLMNLVRLGNKKVLKRYNCQYLRKAAINVTRITTGVVLGFIPTNLDFIRLHKAHFSWLNGFEWGVVDRN